MTSSNQSSGANDTAPTSLATRVRRYAANRALVSWLKAKRWPLLVSLVLLSLLALNILLLRSVIGGVILFFPLIVSVYESFPDAWRSWIRENFFFYSAAITLLFALAFLILWLVVTLVSPSRFGLRVITLAGESPPANQLEITYPSTILADDQPVTITLHLDNKTSLSDTLAVTISWPSSLMQFASADTKTFHYTFPLSQTGLMTTTLALINARTLDVPTIGQVLMLTVASGQMGEQTNPLPVSVESEWEYTARRFVNSTVNQNSPLIILVAGLLSGAGALYGQYRQREKEHEAKERESVRKVQAQNLLEQFKVALLTENLIQAKKILQELEGLHDVIPEEIRRAHILIRIAEGQDAARLSENIQNTRVWADECVAVYVMAHRHLLQSNPDEVREARLYLPTKEDVKSPELWNRLEAIKDELDVQPIEWSYIHIMPDAAVLSASSPFLDHWLQGKNPFASERADDEQYTLFDQRTACFWSGHPLSLKLTNALFPHVINGASGTGRTALALALGQYIAGHDHLSLYLPGQPTLAEIQSGFAKRLLVFVQHHPTRLGKLSAAERSLLARLFVIVLGKEYTRAEIKVAQSNLSFEHESWKKLALHQLLLLEQEISRTTSTTQPYETWLRELIRCARSLHFVRFTLVLDTSEENGQWLNSYIAPSLRPWHSEGLVTHLFIPGIDFMALAHHDGITLHGRLTWSTDDLREWARWRYSMMMRDRTNVDDLFEPSQFDRLISLSTDERGDLTPRRFIQLWNLIVQAKPVGETSIDDEDIRRIL